MSKLFTIILLASITIFNACKTSKVVAPTTVSSPITVSQQPAGAPAKGMAINIGGTMWHADTYAIQQMGTFWIVKGTASDGSVFSIMLPDPMATREYTVEQGGEASITYSTDRAHGHVFFAPFSNNNGWVKTTLTDGYLQGTLEVTITNSAIEKVCKGMFMVPLK